MIDESNIDKAALIRALDYHYPIQPRQADFFPYGWVSACYVIECADGSKYFLKLHDDESFVPFAASDRDFYLDLSYNLRTQSILSDIAYPILNHENGLISPFGGFDLILFNFIEGKVLGFDGLPEDVLAEVARLMGILHRNGLMAVGDHRFVESFDIGLEAVLLQSLEDLKIIATNNASQAKRDLSELLLSHEQALLALLDCLKMYRDLAIAAGKDMVVCHTDLHGGNMIRDPTGTLHILDWENAMIAPPEHDLFAYVGWERFWDLFLPIYESEFGPADLNTAVFGFYLYRRNLEDLADYVVRILHTDQGDEQDQEDLRQIQSACMAGWPYLEPTITSIAEKLDQLTA